MKWFKRRKKAVVIGAIVLSSGISLAFVEDYYFEVSKNLDIYTTLFRDVNMYYVDSVQPGELMKKGIDAMLGSLDPYTVFIPESDIEEYRMTHVSAEYGGIGALVHLRDGKIEISEIYDGFPAQKSGLKVGDQILSVNGNSTQDRRVEDVTNFMKGQKATSVNLKIKREGVELPIEKTIVRDEIKFKNVPYYGMLNSTTGYIKLTQFLENSANEVRQALIDLKKDSAMTSLVLDLRGNGGGLLRDAVDIVNLFVDEGQKIVSQRGKIREMNMEYFATKTAVDPQIPLVVLIDRGSASASEIVTGAMQELDRGVVIGQRTFGKGLVQQTYNLSYNTLMKVTIAKYYTPSGRCIQALDYTHRSSDGSVSKVPDSLINEFKTKGNRLVYDGSGIFPDIYTDPRAYSSVTQALFRNYHIFDYANKFARENVSIASARDFSLTEDQYQDFIRYLDGKSYEYTDRSEMQLEEFKTAAQKEKRFASLDADFDVMKKKLLEDKKKDLLKRHDEIKKILEGEIVSRYYYQNGRLETGFKNDVEIQKAIEILNDKTTYSSILNGEGKYAVIGKPGSESQVKSLEEREDDEMH
ncbi:MAG TPA: S41 family peptidase [Bacteroidia bacterium]|nr:S41 family peptidase [Bacteroidia bacterium]HNS12028.1 S41 family peptidase [Bacteroidia bacterium]